jgi:hypothetical protein
LLPTHELINGRDGPTHSAAYTYWGRESWLLADTPERSSTDRVTFMEKRGWLILVLHCWLGLIVQLFTWAE